MSSLQQPFVIVVVDSSRLVMRILYNFSCSISHMLLLSLILDSNLANLEATVAVG